jgi:uncharacterized Ntn-hydrolase superfamily protein
MRPASVDGKIESVLAVAVGVGAPVVASALGTQSLTLVRYGCEATPMLFRLV